jgi:hypothetical protein
MGGRSDRGFLGGFDRTPKCWEISMGRSVTLLATWHEVIQHCFGRMFTEEIEGLS